MIPPCNLSRAICQIGGKRAAWTSPIALHPMHTIAPAWRRPPFPGAYCRRIFRTDQRGTYVASADVSRRRRAVDAPVQPVGGSGRSVPSAGWRADARAARARHDAEKGHGAGSRTRHGRRLRPAAPQSASARVLPGASRESLDEHRCRRQVRAERAADGALSSDGVKRQLRVAVVRPVASLRSWQAAPDCRRPDRRKSGFRAAARRRHHGARRRRVRRGGRRRARHADALPVRAGAPAAERRRACEHDQRHRRVPHLRPRARSVLHLGIDADQHHGRHDGRHFRRSIGVRAELLPGHAQRGGSAAHHRGARPGVERHQPRAHAHAPGAHQRHGGRCRRQADGGRRRCRHAAKRREHLVDERHPGEA